MKPNILKTTPLILVLLVAGGPMARAQSSELDQLKAAMEAMQKNMQEMQKKILELEQQKAAAPVLLVADTIAGSASVLYIEKAAGGGDVGTQSRSGTATH